MHPSINKVDFQLMRSIQQIQSIKPSKAKQATVIAKDQFDKDDKDLC